MVLMRCVQCFASNAYSCFSRAALTSMAVLKVLVSISIIVIVAVKLEDVRIEVQLPSAEELATLGGLTNLTTSLISGSSSNAAGDSSVGDSGADPAVLPPVTSPAPSEGPSPSAIDLNTTAGPLHVDAACLLQKKNRTIVQLVDGNVVELDGNSRTMCSYVYSVCAISLFATLVMASLLWCTCHLCGWGPILELSFALLGTVWWLVAALVLQENTTVEMDAAPAAIEFLYGNVRSPPPAPRLMELLPPPPMAPPPAPIGEDVVSQVEALAEKWMPQSLPQWRQAVVILSWIMMGMFAASSVLLLVEACGCLLDCCSCLCRCCCCPERPESRWRANLRRRKRMAGEEYVEMCGGNGVSPASQGSASAPSVMVVARSDESAILSNGQKYRSWWG